MCLQFPPFKKGDALAFWCESHVQRIISQQQTNGVAFDEELARENINVLETTREELYNTIRPILSLEVEQPYKGPVNKPFLKSGEYSSQVTSWYQDSIPDIGGPFSRVEFVEPDLGSRTKLVAQLLRLGWEPSSYTKRTEKGGGGNPQLTIEGEPCPNLLKMTGVGADIARWYVAKHRQSQIEGWFKKLRPDGRLTAGANTIGTPTYRFTHNTVVNVPKAAKQVWFGSLMRACFKAADGWKLVGHDGSGLELRMLAHYMNDPDFITAVISGNSDDGTDAHSLNMRMAGLPNRDDAKTFIYAFMYGAGDGKLGQIVKGTAADGKKLRARFLAANKNLSDLISGVKSAGARGYLVGLDGRRIYLRRDKFGRLQLHKALNTLLQTAGAVVMKYSMVWLDFQVRKEGLRVRKVIDMHDESQAEVHPEDVERYKELAEQSLVWAGEYLQLNCPLAAEAKVGNNWAETH